MVKSVHYSAKSVSKTVVNASSGERRAGYYLAQRISLHHLYLLGNTASILGTILYDQDLHSNNYYKLAIFYCKINI